MTPEETATLLNVIEGVVRSHAPSGQATVQYAHVDPTYTSGQPRLIFEGELSLSVKGYPRLFPSSYTPAPNERVAVLMQGASGFILGPLG